MCHPLTPPIKRLPACLQVLNELGEDRLDKWRWQAFVGEEASLDILYQEAPDTPSRRCLTKVGGCKR